MTHKTEGGIYDTFIEKHFKEVLPTIEIPEKKGTERVKYFDDCNMKELSTGLFVLPISVELKEKMKKRSKKLSNRKSYFKRK